MARQRSVQESLPALWRTVVRFAPYAREHRALIAGAAAALAAEIALRLLEPWPLKFVFDRLFDDRAAGATPGWLGALDGLDPAVLLALSALAVVAITSLRALAAYATTVGFSLVGNRVLTKVRGDVFQHVHRLSIAFFSRARSGDLVLRVMNDVGLLKEVAVTAVLPLIIDSLILAGMVVLMLWLNWRLGLVMVALLPLFLFLMTRSARRIRQVAHRQRRQEGAMASTATESIGAMKVVHSLSLETAFTHAFASESEKSLTEGVRATRLSAGLERTVDVLIAVATAVVLWYGARLAMRGALSPGDLLVFLAYLKQAFKPMKDFAKYTGRLAKAASAGERVIELLDREPDVRDLPGARPAPAFGGHVVFERVSFAYEPDCPVLEHVTIEARPGDRIAVVGPSGSGKSTLVALLLRLFDPTRGRVTIDGQDIRDYTIASLRAQISVVLQDTMLFAASVRDNIALGAPAAAPDEVEAAARLANAHEFIERMPNGYDTPIGERGVTLSAGQRQRIAIARAAVRRAPILILDEATTGLDVERERAVVDALERLARGRTTFVVTHDLRQAATADTILFLDGGRIAERGTHEELMRAGGRYATLDRLQDEPSARAPSRRTGALAI